MNPFKISAKNRSRDSTRKHASHLILFRIGGPTVRDVFQ